MKGAHAFILTARTMIMPQCSKHFVVFASIWNTKMAAPKKMGKWNKYFLLRQFFTDEIQPGLNNHWMVPYAICVSCFDWKKNKITTTTCNWSTLDPIGKHVYIPVSPKMRHFRNSNCKWVFHENFDRVSGF